jgi:hypothetical protein
VEEPVNLRAAWEHRLGDFHVHPAGVAGGVLLLAALAFHVLVVQPGETRVDALREAVARRAHSVRQVSMPPPDMPNSAADKLQAFYAFFHRGMNMSDWLARIYDVAERAGVSLQQGDYRLAESGDAPLDRYEVTLPVSGDYGKIRSFAEGVLNVIPVASLDHIAFRRQRPNQGDVDAEMRFTVYLERAR